MKRLFWAIIAVYVIAGTYLFLTLKPTTHQVKIVTIKEHLSMLIYPDEELSVLVHFDRMDTFYSSLNLVVNATLSCDSISVPIELHTWETSGETIYQNDEYAVTVLTFSVNSLDMTNMELNWENVCIELEYINQSTIRLEYGDWDIRFMEDEHSSLLDVTSLWMEERTDPFEAAVHIQMSSLIASDILIHSIRVWSTDMQTNETVPFVISQYDQTEYVLEILSNSNQPIHSRFPIVIEYECLGQTQYYWVDDYRFYREFTHSLEENAYEKHLITPQY